MSNSITQKDIEDIQNDWGQSIVEIGQMYLEKKNYKEEAKKHVKRFYGFEENGVLFKPTKAAEIQFRNTFDGALSYFIGENPDFPEDNGFALQPWTDVEFENAGFILNQSSAFVMGNYYFTNTEGEVTKVEYTIGLFISKNGKLKINVHHSSLPFT